MAELVVDSFAGGGGTSEGIRMAIGRDPDIAINHDALALAMHRVNHPGTHHMVEDVWSIDARRMCDGLPIGLLWLSPDCKHFSKAKGGKPRNKDIRGLAWVGLQWVKSLPKRQRPRIIILENVEEFQDWGPLLEDGKPCPIQKGATFRRYVEGFGQLGYKAEWRELRACDYGDPTIRKRLFVIMRSDRKPIIWPERTHGNPKDARDADLIAASTLKPWRTAAEIIDFALPCPSIFDSASTIKDKLGIRAVRPLADNTMARVAKGTMRYVVNAAKPFLVSIGERGESTGIEPVAESFACSSCPPWADPTPDRCGEASQDGQGHYAPFITKFNRGATGHRIDEPLATVTSHASETHGGGAAPLGLVAPILVGCGGRAGQSEPRPADEPVLTQTAKADACVVAPFLVPRYGERPGQAPRTRAVDEPAAVIVPTANEGSLTAVHLSRQFGQSIGSAADEPAPTVMADGAGKTALISAHLSTMRNSGKPFSAADEPTQTMTAGGANAAVVAAFLAQHTGGSHPGEPAKELTEPVPTITAKGCQTNLVSAHLLNMRGSERRDADIATPLRTESAQGNHAALVAAFLAKYYGNDEFGQAADDPIHTITAKDRHSLVTVAIDGETFVINDIGMRMLTPRERFSAQGFRPNYIISYGVLEDGGRIQFTLEQQGRMCGNSVCPGMARALVAANYQPKAGRDAPALRSAPLLEAAE